MYLLDLCFSSEPAFCSDTKSLLFGKKKLVNLNLITLVAKPLSALVTYHGGVLSPELDETCTHAVLTLESSDPPIVDFKSLGQFLDQFEIEVEESIFELLYSDCSKSETKRKFSSVKLVTPDWIADCVRENKLVDEFKYHPAFSTFLAENKATLTTEAVQEPQVSEGMDIELEANKNEDAASKDQKQIFKLNTSNAVINNRLLQLSQAHEKPVEIKPAESDAASKEADTSSTRLDGNEDMATASSLSNTPTKKIYKRNRKPANGQSGQPSQNGHGGVTTTAAASGGNLDMDDIFQSVLLAADDQSEQESKSSSAKKKDSATKHAAANGNKQPTSGILPIYLNLLRPQGCSEDKQSLAHLSTSITFDEDSVSQDQYCTQENSHLIQFNRCLLGCVFYLKPSLVIYTQDCLNDWENVISRFGGVVSAEYTAEVTHVLCPNRYVDIYRQAMLDKKRVVTAYWLEDVLQEQKMRPPWCAYHFPSLYDLRQPNVGPLSNHIVSTHGFYGKEKLILKTLIWLLNGKYSSYLTNINSFLISKNTVGAKVDKAHKWNIPVVNGVWLSELYLGNTNALSKNLSDRYTNINQIQFNNSLININHFAYDHIYVSDFMDQWKTLIRLPAEHIKVSILAPSAGSLGLQALLLVLF